MRVWRNWNHYTLLVRMQIDAVTVENSSPKTVISFLYLKELKIRPQTDSLHKRLSQHYSQ